MEVADTSLKYDRGVKMPLYMGEEVREYWIVNLVEKLVEKLVDVYRPVAGGAPSKQVFRRGESLAPLAFPDLVLSVEELLG